MKSIGTKTYCNLQKFYVPTLRNAASTMETPANRRPILKKNVEAFVPSPRFLSESPVHQLNSGGPTPPHISPNTFSPSPSILQLRSPVPPPPANLIGGNPDAFNVDPGVPFLATVGPSDAGDSDKGSINEFESPKRTVGEFVTGLKKALTIKRSRRKSSKYQQEDIYPPPMMVRDSGYATSNRLEEPLATQPPPLTSFSPSPPPTRDLPLATSNDYQTTNDHGHDAPSLDSVASAVTALVGYGPDYIKMDRPTPPQSDVSFNTYMTRFQDFVHELAGLPWMANERVTVDYCPSAPERIRKRHRPFITWHSKDCNYADYHLDSETDSSILQMTPHLRLRAPSHASRTDINLESEFSDRTRSPFPNHPQSILQTPDHRFVRSELEGVHSDLEGEVRFPSPLLASDPLSNPTEWFYPNRGNAPKLYPPNSGQTPNMTYQEESRPEWRNDVNPSSKTTSARRYSSTGPAPLPSPNTGRTHDKDPRLGSRNANATFSTSSNQRWEGTPKPESSPFPRPTPKTPPSNRPPKPGSGQQPTLGSPSRPHKSHTTSQGPHHESTGEWGNYVREQTGYVPFEFSENFYGNRYGVGIHGLLPPVGRASSGTSMAPSIKQPQPQYPKSTLVTSPSRPGSNS